MNTGKRIPASNLKIIRNSKQILKSGDCFLSGIENSSDSFIRRVLKFGDFYENLYNIGSKREILPPDLCPEERIIYVSEKRSTGKSNQNT